MCGIVGLISNNKIKDIKKRIKNMNNSQVHRGPESGREIVINEKIAVGHRRLAIIDTHTGANQPMISNSKRWTLTFNGEIYNYKEIEKELSYTFNSASDTEAIIGAVEEKGIEWFLKKANGMFAIGLYDIQEEKLYLLRDRMGIKPLYYTNQNDNFIFASEVKGILNSGLVDANFNEEAIDEYLGNRYIRAPYTFFKDVYQVNSGSYLIIDKELNIEEKKYWDLPKEFNTDLEFDEKEQLEKFETEFLKAVKRRLAADVPLGCYLSGGVDSSLLSAITAIEKKEKINTYTIGFPELNEFEYSKLLADKYETNHHILTMGSNDYLGKWEKLISYKDAPLGVPNEIPLAIMSEKLKEDITVVLSGEGADELLGGYGKIYRSAFDYKNEETELSFYEYFREKYEYVSRNIRDKFLNTPTNLRNEFDKKIISEFEQHPNEENIFRFFHTYHVKGLLQRVDMTTMETAVEARVPFLDHELIEYSYKNIPYNLKLKWKDEACQEKAKTIKANEYSEILDIPKYILRELSYKYLPKEIIEREKMGFPVPLTKWFKDLEKLAVENLSNVNWLKNGMIEELIKESKVDSRAGQVLWMFINVELFRKKYFEKKWRY